MKSFLGFLFFVFFMGMVQAQTDADTYQNNANESYEEDTYVYPENDPTREGQQIFVEELLDLAGFVHEKIEVYQTLSNKARVFRVRFDSVNGAFVFVRWDKVKRENYIDNRRIDPGIYYSLKTAREIMRKQTDQASFGVDDAAIQAGDQESISSGELQDLREEYKLQQEERKQKEMQQQSSKRTPRLRRQRRQLKKNN
ncbi:MAG: hypothetical protein ACON47_10555 [Flavobacteriaceae bacterium]